MSRLWLFVHLLGFTMWLGGGLAAMVTSIAAKREDRAALGAVARAQAALYKAIIGPGALLTVLSGLILTMQLVGGPLEIAAFNHWLMMMQGTGIIGALLALFISVPTAARLGRLDPTGPDAAYFDELRGRQRIVSMVWGTLGVLALLAGAMVR